MTRLFISYRRADTQAITNRMVERLEREFGRRRVFFDVDLGAGAWLPNIERAILASQVGVVVIGTQWLDMPNAAGTMRRLDELEDTVRREVELILNQCPLVVIVLADGAPVPQSDALPRTIRKLPEHNAFPVHSSDTFDADMGRVIRNIRQKYPRRVSLLTALAAVLVVLALIGIGALAFSGGQQPTPTGGAMVAAGVTAGAADVTADTPLRVPTGVGDVPTDDFVATRFAALLTETRLAQPTDTPRPTDDMTATIETGARATLGALMNASATATHLTPPPTPTPTPMPTVTLSPLAAALERAARFAGTRNAEWTPFEWTFDGVRMMLVPTGCFMMGSSDGASDEQPVHQQCFETPFWIDRTEVTNAQYGGAADLGVCEDYSSAPDQPRICVDWFAARDYCEGRGAGVRLPGEAEWEYAARGIEAWVYPWGDTWDADNAVWIGNSGGETAAVGSLPAGASWVGALDMSGNVWEWTRSLYRPYPYDQLDGREDADNRTDVRVLRGGAWGYGSDFLRASVRDDGAPDYRYFDLGFRCARSA